MSKNNVIFLIECDVDHIQNKFLNLCLITIYKSTT